MGWWTSIKSFFATLIREPEEEKPVGVLDEFKDEYPDGIPFGEDEEEMVARVLAAGEGLSEEEFQADVDALSKAIAANQKKKFYMAIIKAGANIGLKFV